MAAPSLKSGTGHTQIGTIWADSTNASAADLWVTANNKGTTNPSGLNGHITSPSYSGIIGSNATGTNNTTTDHLGGKRTHTAVSCNAEGSVVLMHVRGNGTNLLQSTETCANNGILVTLRSTTGNDRTWCVGGRDHVPVMNDFIPIIIDPRQTSTQFNATGTLDCTSIAQSEVHVKNFSTGTKFASAAMGAAYVVTPYTLINGESGNKGSIATILTAIDSAYLRNCPRATSNILQLFFSYHIGDGTTLTYSTDTGKTFIFPSQASAANLNMQAHIPDGHIGIKFTGTGTSTCVMTNCTTLGPHYFRMAGISGDSNTLTSCSINNATEVTLSQYTTLVSCSFASCAMIDATAGPSFTTCTVSGTTGTYGIDMGAKTTLSGIAFTALGSSDYAIKITPTATASFTLSSCTFSGYATGKKIYVNDANAAHTITISGSGIAAADITSAGATIVVPSTSTTIKHDTLTTGTRYRVYNVTAAAELTNSTCSGTGFSDAHTTGISDGDTIRLTTTYQSGTTVKWGGAWLATATLGGTVDFTANEPETIGEFATWGVDGSTVTECASDYGNIEVEISTGSSTLDRRRILAFMAYAMTTADGIRNWFDLMSILDASNVVIDESVADMNWVNTHATQHVVLTQTSIWIRRADGAALLLGSGPGLTMEVSPVYAISAGSGLTGSESAHLLAIPTNPATSTALQTVDDNVDAIKAKTDGLTFTVAGKVDGNITNVGGTAITGSGTTADPWGP